MQYLEIAAPQEALDDINRELEGLSSVEIVRWELNEFGPDITLACSFEGVSGMALLNMTLKMDPAVSVFYADTDFLFPETYALIDAIAKRYGIHPRVFKLALIPEEQAAKYSDALWSRDPDLCCELRKVQPTAEALKGYRAWITGIRRDQAASRGTISIVAWDSRYELVKVNPLVNWDDVQVREYLRENDVPYNPLNDQGYPSLGCTHCTRAVNPGEDPRAGRCSGFDKTERGIHQPLKETGSNPSFLSVLQTLTPGG